MRTRTPFWCLGLILSLLLVPTRSLAVSRWEMLLRCGNALASATQWLRRDPSANYSPETLRLASEEVPSSGNRLLDWLATARPYLNPEVSAVITRGLRLFPELASPTPPSLPDPSTADRQDVWANLLDKDIALNDFEAQVAKAQTLLTPEERQLLARYLFTRGVRSAVKDPQNTNDDALKRALLLVKGDTQIQRSVMGQMRRQFPVIGSLPLYGDD